MVISNPQLLVLPRLSIDIQSPSTSKVKQSSGNKEISSKQVELKNSQ